ncbi:hypothetical protein OSB04_013714 [Centaurea solstitialis]|uniref:Micro-fibrillar-associated protein 1 C-terminal domain-containing protein n=1 Tax=Centaurea solstitialis TaxID=347529 RepID=A0AA38WNM5_9ASTR|nr:hypothetical protein OSB04_013714 [Centaurea solstitialis]
MSVTAGVSDTVIAVRDKLRGKIGQTKVKRYWPGKAPEWADDGDEEGDMRMARSVALENAFPSREEDSGIVKRDDPRLRRLAENRLDNKEEVRADHRRIRQAEIISTEEEEQRRQERLEFEEDDEDALDERRRRIREKLLQREQEEAAAMIPEEEEEEEEEESSEYETDSEEEQMGMAMVKPVFVPKSERDTIAEREKIEAEERAIEELMKRRVEERKVETKQIVVEEIRKDMEIQKNLEAEANIADVETDDELLNKAEEDEAWKARVIARIKRDREDRDALVKEREEIERVRNMTEEERREWERKNPKPAAANKQKWRFMQKYYHKGAFFQDDPDDTAATVGSDGIFQRDFSAPTGEDKMDKTILPKVMQVKHFGRSGRTKWTHLVNEDTTDWNNPYVDSLLCIASL